MTETAKHQFHKFPCFEDDVKRPTAITCCGFDATGRRLAFAFGDHRVLLLSQNTENDPIKNWDRTTCTASTKACIVQISWNVR